MSKLLSRVLDLNDVELITVFKKLNSTYDGLTAPEQRVWIYVFNELHSRGLITVDDDDEVIIKEEI